MCAANKVSKRRAERSKKRTVEYNNQTENKNNCVYNIDDQCGFKTKVEYKEKIRNKTKVQKQVVVSAIVAQLTS